MPEIIIVGSGAAAVAAALELVQRGIRPLMLDVGRRSRGGPRADGNLYDYRRRHDSFDLHIGQDLGGLANVLGTEESIAKLNAPNMAFVTEDAGRLSPLEQTNFRAVQSFAMGGLGNAWGAGMYRWIDADLRDFPIRLAELEPYFDKLTQEIGISGDGDDLAAFFGRTDGLLPPLRLSHNAQQVYAAYRRKRADFRRRSIFVGHPRVGVLSVGKDGRPACDYSNLEFWQPQPYVYTPAVTLQRLIAYQQIDYRPGVQVISWTEAADRVVVHAIDVDTGQPRQFDGQRLLLAAGAINTARIALQSRGDHYTRLPLLENPIVQIPVVLPASIGRRLDTDAFGLVQLNLIWDSPAYRCLLQGSLLELTAPMRAEFFGRFPLSARANLALVKYMLPAMMMLQLYFPAWVQEPFRLSLREDGRLRIEGEPFQPDLRQLGDLLASLRSLGLWTHPALIQQPVTGHAVHYAGTLPMRSSPGPYECDPAGRLHGAERVYVADSASFSNMSAKNMSLGMMANAMRIAASAVGAPQVQRTSPVQQPDQSRDSGALHLPASHLQRTSPVQQPDQSRDSGALHLPASHLQRTSSTGPASQSQDPGALQVKTVLITGAGGFIARHLAATLHEAGLRVIGTSRNATSVAGFDQVYPASLGGSLEPVLATEQVDAVVHAALAAGPEAYAVNVDGTTRWFYEAKAAGVPLQIFLSTLSATPDALSDYGRSKYVLEQIFLAGGQVVFRMGVVVGDGGMFARIVGTSRRSPVVPLMDNGRQLIYVLGIDYLCNALRDCIVQNGEGLRGRAWNMHQPRPYTLREVVQAVDRGFGFHPLLLPVPTGPVLAAVQLAEKLPIHLPISSANVKGLIQQGQQHIPSDFASFGYPEESLEDLVARAASEWPK